MYHEIYHEIILATSILRCFQKISKYQPSNMVNPSDKDPPKAAREQSHHVEPWCLQAAGGSSTSTCHMCHHGIVCVPIYPTYLCEVTHVCIYEYVYTLHMYFVSFFVYTHISSGQVAMSYPTKLRDAFGAVVALSSQVLTLCPMKTWMLMVKSLPCEQRETNPYDIPLNPGWLMGILIIMSYYSPYITG